MKFFKKQLVCIGIFVMVLFVGFQSTIKAAKDPNVDIDPYVVVSTDSNLSSVVQQVNQYSSKEHQFNYLKVDTSKGTIKVVSNKNEYDKLVSKQKQDLMNKTLELFKKSSYNSRDKSKVFNFIKGTDGTTSRFLGELSADTSADIAFASAFIRPGLSPLSMVLGVLIMLGIMLVPLQFTLDIVYVVIPTSHGLFAKPKKSKTYGEGYKSVRFVSKEAYQSYEDYATGASEVTPVIALSIKRVIPTLMFLVVIGVLLTGRLLDITGWLMDFIDNILRVAFQG